MKITHVDLNLLVCLHVLLQTHNVSRAAEQLNLTQSAMSNSLKRLRTTLNDPLLIRTHQGMMPTDYALSIQPALNEALGILERSIQPQIPFAAPSSKQLFRIMCSDYAEATLLPALQTALHTQAPNIQLDILTPSDVSIHDVEQGHVDLAINRFEQLPSTFHQKTRRSKQRGSPIMTLSPKGSLIRSLKHLRTK